MRSSQAGSLSNPHALPGSSSPGWPAPRLFGPLMCQYLCATGIIPDSVGWFSMPMMVAR